MSKITVGKELPVIKRKDKTLPGVADFATRLVNDLEHAACCYCPVTGLLLPLSDMPPIPGGFMLTSYHPIVYNALAILDHTRYYLALEKSMKAALILAGLAALNKLTLDAPAVVVRAALETRLETTQLNDMLGFLAGAMRTTKKHYPKAELGANLDDMVLQDYVNKCVDVENTRLAWDLEPQTAKAPTIASSKRKAKWLNEACHDAWLDLAAFLPADLKAKAKPYVKELATILDDRLVQKLVSACRGRIQPVGVDCGFVGELELISLEEAVASSRKEAAALGLHRSILDEDTLFDQPVKAATQDSPATTAPTSSLAAKLAAFRAKAAI